MNIRKTAAFLTAASLMLSGTALSVSAYETKDYPAQSIILSAEIDLSAETVYSKLMEMQKKYPEGTKWTNANFYEWKGGIYSGGYGCAGFAFMLSDNAFGDLPAREHYDFSDIRVGDIVRMDYDGHSVIVLEVKGSVIKVAEGNYNKSVHWGREIDLSKEQGLTYVMTRYPENTEPDPEPELPIVEYKSGDVDGDGAITPTDALRVLQDVANISKLTGTAAAAADVDGNEEITPEDALKILQIVVGIK